MAGKDYYKILGVSKDASDEDLKQAYKQLVKKYHPDISKEANAEEKLKEITEAYAVLSDHDKRQQYDMFGEDATKGAGSGFSGQGFSFDFSDIFSRFDFSDDDFFSNLRDFGFGRRASSYKQDAELDIKTRLTIDFVTAIRGGKASVNVYKDAPCDACGGTGSKSKSSSVCRDCGGTGRVVSKRQTPFGVFSVQQTCKKCNGSGTVINDPCRKCNGSGHVKVEQAINIEIPAGVNNGDVIRLRGQGNAINGMRGDLFVSVSVKEHEFFKREGNDLYCELPIIYSELVLGTKVKIKGIPDIITLNIPSGTRPDTVFRVQGKGAPDPNKRGVHGSLFVKVILAEPVDVNREYKELLSKLSVIDSKTKKKIQERFKDYITFA